MQDSFLFSSILVIHREKKTFCRKLANTCLTKQLKVFFAIAESLPTSATLKDSTDLVTFRLFNISQWNQNEAVCSQFGGWTRDKQTGEDLYVTHRFGVGHGAESFTTKTSWMVGHYLGNPANPCITVIDTPGTGDTEGKDCKHGIALAEGIKRIGSIDTFMFLFKGTNPRFSQSIQDQIRLYMNIFGREMWRNVITEFTFWRHNQASIWERKHLRGGLNEEVQHNKWNIEYAKRFGVSEVIPSLFIDPVYFEDIAEQNERVINKRNIDKLWTLLTTEMTPFQCDHLCQAPSGFFVGEPWLLPENAVQRRRLGDRAVITWQIWFAGCDGAETESYSILQVTGGNSSRKLYEHQLFDNSTRKNKHVEKVLDGMEVLDEPKEKFKTVQFAIELTEKHHFGSYFIENKKGSSALGNIKQIVDGTWEEWSSFGPCSKTCITLEEPGVMQRKRKCAPPQNGGHPCRGPSAEEQNCAFLQGDAKAEIR